MTDAMVWSKTTPTRYPLRNMTQHGRGRRMNTDLAAILVGAMSRRLQAK
jgi:hypothetical protein